MKSLQLKDGLVVIGGIKDLDKTNFTLQLASELAKNEKVLFLNWTKNVCELKEDIDLSEIDAKNLSVDISIGTLGIESLMFLIELIDQCKYTTIIIDDLNSFTETGTNFESIDEYNPTGKTVAIKVLKFLVEKYNIRIVFNLSVNKGVLSHGNIENFARDFIIEKDCSQVIALPDNYETIKKADIFQLKENSLIIENYKINL